MKEVTVKEDSFVLGKKTQGVETQDYNEMMTAEKTGPLFCLFQKTETRNCYYTVIIINIQPD